jgi:hypothetical protein
MAPKRSHARASGVRQLCCAEAHGTVHTGNGRLIFTAAVRDRFPSLVEPPALYARAETSRLCINMLKCGRTAVGRCRLCVPVDTTAGNMRALHPCCTLLPLRLHSLGGRVQPESEPSIDAVTDAELEKGRAIGPILRTMQSSAHEQR